MELPEVLQLNQISQEAYDDWRTHPATRAFVKYLRNERTDIMEQWASSLFTTESNDGTIQLNANALGRIGVFDALIYAITEDDSHE